MVKHRIHYIDNLRIFLTFLVVAHHAGQAYGPTGGMWVVDDVRKAHFLGNFFFINASFMMGLFFFISGYFLRLSLGRKSKEQLLKDRLRRLGVPLVVITLFVFLPFNFFNAEGKQGVVEVFVDTYFNKPPIATGHLWFVASLLLYTLFFLSLVKSEAEPESQVSERPLKRTNILLYVILLTVVSAFVRLYYPLDAWRTWIIPVEVAHLPQYLSLFLIGTLFCKHGWLEKLKFGDGIVLLLLSVGAYVGDAYFLSTTGNLWLTQAFIESLLCVGISAGTLVIFRRFMNSQNPLSKLVSDNAFGVYLLHLFVVILIQKMLLPLDFAAAHKFVIVAVLSIILSVLISHLIRQIRPIRAYL